MLSVWRAAILDSGLACLKNQIHNVKQWHLVQTETVAKKKEERKKLSCYFEGVMKLI